jgi:hypothetical protein
VYQSWWEVKRDGLWDFDTWMMKVCGRSDWVGVERVSGIRRRKRKRKMEELAIGVFVLLCLEKLEI